MSAPPWSGLAPTHVFIASTALTPKLAGGSTSGTERIIEAFI
jgi:hypothetical protein